MTFRLDENRLIGADYRMEVYFSDVMKAFNKRHQMGNRQLLQKSYRYAEMKHAGVMRKSGEPYIKHPLRAARCLAEWGFESEVIAAAFLHDVVEDCDTPLSEIEAEFGSHVARIVDAVTALSDKDFGDRELSKQQKDMLSDVRLQTMMNDEALFVKIADRIDNLNTISGVPLDKRIPKAEHTREILLPIAKHVKAYFFVNVLEELCFEIEHPGEHRKVNDLYEELCLRNLGICEESLTTLASIFDPESPNIQSELEPYRRHIRDFWYTRRSLSSIYMQIYQGADNIKKDLKALLCKEKIPQYDMILIVSDELGEKGAPMNPDDVFFSYFRTELSKKGFYFVDIRETDLSKTTYYLLADRMDNLYRFFVRTESGHQRYLYGNIVDADKVLSIPNVNDVDPRETFNRKIKVFRRDGSAMEIDENATVLDFAFYIHTDLGLHFDYAMVNGTTTQLPPYTRLNSGDTVVIVQNPEAAPTFSWFNYARTVRATHHLVHYFNKLYGTGSMQL